MDKLNGYLEMPLVWKEVPDDSKARGKNWYIYFTSIKGNLAEVTLNELEDMDQGKPNFSLYVENEKIGDIENWPDNWTRPAKNNVITVEELINRKIAWSRTTDSEFPFSAELPDGTRLKLQDNQDLGAEEHRYYLFKDNTRMDEGFDAFPAEWKMAIAKGGKGLG